MARIGSTDLDVSPLCLGGNVFGWTADEAASLAVLDAYVEAGGSFIDTADSYSHWAPGNRGGESETIIGRWLARRGRRDDLVIATKVGHQPQRPGLSASAIAAAAEGSLRRLGVDHIDLYYAHEDDPATPLEETLGAFDALVRAGKVRHIAASNYGAARLREALATSERLGAAAFVALQPHYNLVHRAEYEGELADVCGEHGLSCVPYYALASGLLTGKYRQGRALPESARAGDVADGLSARTDALLDELERVASAHEAPVAAVALAWLAAQPTVVAPIASARTPAQLAELMRLADVRLEDDELAALGAAGAAVA